MREQHNSREELSGRALVLFLATNLLCGCSHLHSKWDGKPEPAERKVFALKEITPEQARVFLSRLGITEVSVSSKHGAVMVDALAEDLHKAGVILDLVDTREEFVIETLAPVSRARMIPANDRIAAALGHVSIGTFADPPKPDRKERAIIDIHGESVVAVMPSRLRRSVLDTALAKLGQVAEGIDQPAQAANGITRISTGGLVWLAVFRMASALMLAAARLRYIAGSKWGTRRYMNMQRLQELKQEQAEDVTAVA